MMFCRDCEFHQSGYMWNRCDLTESEYYHKYYDKPCPCIDDNYIFIKDCEEMGFVKGKSAIGFLKGGEE